ncbi:MAG: energy transducer TonB [Bacteroidia bacterium]|nr:MAG: energy transducer TonB [Bacteroidia bacterium]
MEPKKYAKADLEKWKGTFTLLGLLITVGVILLAFEWSTETSSVENLAQIEDVVIEEDIIPVTRQEVKPPPPPPPAPKVSEVINIVEDDVEIEEEYEVEDVEVDQETEIEVVQVEEEVEEEQIFFIVEEMPEFPGGERALRTFIAKNVQYPTIARENDIKGKVYVRFVVTEKGTVDKVTVARGVDPLLDAEAIRVVKKLPKWKPGKQRGKNVKVWYTVPINFQLQ